MMAGSAGAETTEILKITVGEPTTLSAVVTGNCASVAVSRTGVVAAFYPPRPSARPEVYRVSTDGGLTWGEELSSPGILGGGACGTGLREGGVIRMIGTATPEPQDEKAPHRILFSDDFVDHETERATVSVPGAVIQTWDMEYPAFANGKILQLSDGSLLAAMFGRLKGDKKHRAMLVRSTDKGLTWQYYSTVAYDANDPAPELAGQYVGFCEASLAILRDGRLLCIMRTQGTHVPVEYRPLYVSWSEDLGKTWTKPEPTQPHLMNISPTLAVLDNGVVACAYGRPGFHVAFSTDDGHTWRDRISFSHRGEPIILGQGDMVKVGPNRLLAIGSMEEGTKVFPISVERVKVSPARVPLAGRVLDEAGTPISRALVELGPNRYVADSYIQPEEGAKLDKSGAAPEIVGVPELRYYSIRRDNGYPTVETDTEGRFRFEAVELGELILTVEAEGYAPQYRRVTVVPDVGPQDVRLNPGRSVRGRVVSEQGDPLPGFCVVIRRSHIHTDADGFFHWAADGPVPGEVGVEVLRKRDTRYEPFKDTVSLSQIEEQPITLKKSR